jgi:hypothetical protein
LKPTISVVAIIGGLFFLNGAVVVHKYESAVVLGVDVTLCALVSRAQIALGVIGRQSSLGSTLLRASIDQREKLSSASLQRYTMARNGNTLPGPLGSVGRDQNMGSAKRIESPVGDIIKNVLHFAKKELVTERVPWKQEVGKGEGEYIRKRLGKGLWPPAGLDVGTWSLSG